MNKKEECVAVCQKTGKIVLMAFSNAERKWICCHRETRAEEEK